MAKGSVNPAAQRRWDLFQKMVLLATALAISWLFYRVIQGFFLSVFMAGIVAGMARPLFLWLNEKTGGREKPAAGITLLLLVILGLLPTLFLLGVLVSEAISVSESMGPWIQEQMSEPDRFQQWLQSLPVVGQYVPSAEVVLGKLGELASRAGAFLVASLAAATRGTAHFFLQMFVGLYALWYFLLHGPEVLRRALYVFPLTGQQETRLVEKFASVARATIKGTLVIGVVQGGLAALGFWAAGIHGVVFWGFIMVILSIIPLVGAALIWIPAVIYLFMVGKVMAGILLLAWCGIVVSSSDNVLRPALVGRDTKMPDLMVLLSTLGGLTLFGVVGFIVGPIVAALFMTIWDIYTDVFKDFLPPVDDEATGVNLLSAPPDDELGDEPIPES